MRITNTNYEEVLRPRIRPLRWAPYPMIALMVAMDILSMVASVILALLLRSTLGPVSFLDFYTRMWPLPIFMVAFFAVLGLYPAVGLSPANEFKKLAYGISVLFIFVASLSFILRGGWEFSRSVYLMAWGLSIFLLPLGRALGRSIGSRFNWWGIPAVIITNSRKGMEISRFLRKNRKAGYRPIALLGEGDLSASRLPHGSLDWAPRIEKGYGIEHAILVFPWLSSDELSDIVERFCANYRRVIIVPEFVSGVNLWVTPIDVVGNLGLEISQNLLSPVARVIKRSFDILLSFLLLLLLSPLILLIAMIIVLDSRGAPFYTQRRIGFRGQAFQMLKFRTMIPDAEEQLDDHLETSALMREEWNEYQKLARDPRVTRVGRYLRRLSLDELPQLANVLIGDMSMVGPRPLLPGQEGEFGAAYHLYKRVIPGLTGLWQVSGRNRISFQDRVIYDVHYVRNWSMWLDLYILAKTPFVVVSGEGAF